MQKIRGTAAFFLSFFLSSSSSVLTIAVCKLAQEALQDLRVLFIIEPLLIAYDGRKSRCILNRTQ